MAAVCEGIYAREARIMRQPTADVNVTRVAPAQYGALAAGRMLKTYRKSLEHSSTNPTEQSINVHGGKPVNNRVDETAQQAGVVNRPEETSI